MEFTQMTLKAKAPVFMAGFKLPFRGKKIEHVKNLNKKFTEYYAYFRDCN